MTTQAEKFERFKALHARDETFVIANAWDAGTARILTALGFEALATTSAGLAFSIGSRDSGACLSRDDVLDNARAIVEATDLPVSADLEDGFGPLPEDCAETIRAAVAVGLVGGTLEDATGDPANPIYDFNLAVERVAAAAEAARDLPFLLTARAENHLNGRHDLDDTIRRLQAFEAAGADVLFAPGLPDLDAVRQVCVSVTKPVNFVIGPRGTIYSVAELRKVGVRRISVGGSLARAAFGAIFRAATEIREHGTFTYLGEAMPGKVIETYMSGISRRPDPTRE